MKKVSMYFFNCHVQDGWNHRYEWFTCDADAMMYARTLLGDTCNMVAVYRHRDSDKCGIKDFVASYDRGTDNRLGGIEIF